jgi:hypothetical protein
LGNSMKEFSEIIQRMRDHHLIIKGCQESGEQVLL